jgi:hypothetical protein
MPIVHNLQNAPNGLLPSPNLVAQMVQAIGGEQTMQSVYQATPSLAKFEGQA